MHILMVLYPPPPDPAAFRKYYEERHVPLAATMPGLVAQSHGFPTALGPGGSPCFCVWRGEFRSADDLDAALGSDVGKRVAADVANFSAAPPTLLRFDAR
jgi:uncharacterized protein (TIGR02118 family)